MKSEEQTPSEKGNTEMCNTTSLEGQPDAKNIHRTRLYMIVKGPAKHKSSSAAEDATLFEATTCFRRPSHQSHILPKGKHTRSGSSHL